MDLKILCQIAAHAQKQQKAAVILFQDEMIYITLGSLVVVKKIAYFAAQITPLKWYQSQFLWVTHAQVRTPDLCEV